MCFDNKMDIIIAESLCMGTEFRLTIQYVIL